MFGGYRFVVYLFSVIVKLEYVSFMFVIYFRSCSNWGFYRNLIELGIVIWVLLENLEWIVII